MGSSVHCRQKVVVLTARNTSSNGPLTCTLTRSLSSEELFSGPKFDGKLMVFFDVFCNVSQVAKFGILIGDLSRYFSCFVECFISMQLFV